MLFGVERSISFSFAQSQGAILSVMAVHSLHGLQPDNVALKMVFVPIDGVPTKYWWLPNALIIALEQCGRLKLKGFCLV